MKGCFFGHKDIKDIFSVGIFLDKKTDDLRHKDKKDIFQEFKELEGVMELRHYSRARS